MKITSGEPSNEANPMSALSSLQGYENDDTDNDSDASDEVTTLDLAPETPAQLNPLNLDATVEVSSPVRCTENTLEESKYSKNFFICGSEAGSDCSNGNDEIDMEHMVTNESNSDEVQENRNMEKKQFVQEITDSQEPQVFASNLTLESNEKLEDMVIDTDQKNVVTSDVTTLADQAQEDGNTNKKESVPEITAIQSENHEPRVLAADAMMESNEKEDVVIGSALEGQEKQNGSGKQTEIGVPDLVRVVQFETRQTSDDETSDSDDDSASSSDESVTEVPTEKVISEAEDDDPCSTDKPGKQAKKKLTPEEEYCPGFLPAIEDLTISVEEKQCVHLGKVTSIIDKMVVIQADKNTPALDEDSVLFLDSGRKTLGRVFDTFGCVTEPSYVVRFNSLDHVKERGVELGMDVFCAPQTEHSHFVLISQLLKMKGSDASWKNDIEVPQEQQEYSDDEQERSARRSRKSQKENDRVEVVFEGDRPPSKRGRGRGGPPRSEGESRPQRAYTPRTQGNPFGVNPRNNPMQRPDSSFGQPRYAESDYGYENAYNQTHHAPMNYPPRSPFQPQAQHFPRHPGFGAPPSMANTNYNSPTMGMANANYNSPTMGMPPPNHHPGMAPPPQSSYSGNYGWPSQQTYPPPSPMAGYQAGSAQHGPQYGAPPPRMQYPAPPRNQFPSGPPQNYPHATFQQEQPAWPPHRY